MEPAKNVRNEGNSETVKDFAAHRLHDVRDSLHDVKELARDRSAELVDESVKLVKKYPFTTAIGACAVGLVAGLILRGRR